MKFLSVRWLTFVLAVIGCQALPGAAQSVQHLATLQEGGMPGLPVMGPVSQVTNGVQITWDGPSGYYQVFQKSNSLGAPWTAWGKATNLVRTATITQIYSNAFFRVSGPAPKYAGSKVCISCHLNVCKYETNTAHASAFSDPLFQAAGGQSNPSCLACHTVGYGVQVNGKAVGFVSATATPQLEGVQCENCHGPAANHAGSEDDPTLRPRAEIAATVCGGCHRANTAYSNPPTYEEWSASGHGAVVPDALTVMASATNNINNCGVCHSGSARLAFISGQNPAASVTHDYNVALTCAVCHDPHQTNGAPAQLRNPLFSTNDFHLASSAVASVSAFTNQYNANAGINLCAQCHNDRGAAWGDSSRAPHHSLQYNLLIGSAGVMPGGGTFNPGVHTGVPFPGGIYLTNQCVECHLASDTSGGHDHSLLVNYDACTKCHDGLFYRSLLTPQLSNTVASVITALNHWAAVSTNVPSKYLANGVVAWEYPASDGLTWQSSGSGYVTNWKLGSPTSFAGPSYPAGQAYIPDNIKKARFNLYLVLNDGSMGVHNPYYALTLLNSALGYVGQQLNQ